jgi:hypothetical protein
VRKRLSRARATVRDELLKRFGEFARSTAPGTAFAAAVCSTVMLAAPGTASAIVVGTAAGAGKLGASGLGTTTLGGGAAAGTLGATVNTLMPNSHDILLVIGSIAFGMLSAYLSSLYLLRYAETAQERTQLRRFLRLHVTTAFLFCTSTMATVLLRMGPLPGVLVIAVGMTVLNYQYLVSLPRVMAPMLARDAARHGRRGPTWVYRSLFGRSAVVGASLLVVVAVAYALMGN